MTCATANLTIRCGATWRVPFTYRDASTGAVIDLSGLKARGQIRAVNADGSQGAVVMSLASTGGAPRLLIEAAQGTVTLYVTSADTPLLDPSNKGRELIYGIELYDDSVAPEDVTDFVAGRVLVLPEIVQ
jgi:hypothetical protein